MKCVQGLISYILRARLQLFLPKRNAFYAKLKCSVITEWIFIDGSVSGWLQKGDKRLSLIYDEILADAFGKVIICKSFPSCEECRTKKMLMKIDQNMKQYTCACSGGSRICPGGGGQPQRGGPTYYLDKFFPENCMKVKKNMGPWKGSRPLCPPHPPPPRSWIRH